MVNEPVAPEPLRLQDSTIDIRASLQVLVRRKWYGLGVLVAALVIGALMTIRATRIFRATATLMIERETPQVLGDVREVYDLGTGAFWNAQEYYQTQYVVIHSRPVAERAVASLGIGPEALAARVRESTAPSIEARFFRDPLADLPIDLRGKLGLVGLAGLNSRDDLLEALGHFDAARFVMSRIVVTPVKDSRLVQVSVDHENPEHAALMANAVADAYVEANLDQKVDFTRSAVDWLSDQMSELKNKLEQSELRLFEFKKANNIVSVSMEDRQTIISQTLAQLNESLSKTQARRLAMESQRRRLRSAQSEGLNVAVESVIHNHLVQELKLSRSRLQQEESDLAVKYTPAHPALDAVRKKLRLADRDLFDEISRILATLDAGYDDALDTERRLRAAIETVKAEALEINKKEIEYGRLQRERDNNQALFELVLKRQKEADLTEMLKVNNVRVHEPARAPASPIRPRPALNMLVALVLGLMGGVGLAFLFDYLDNTIKSQEQVQQLLNLPFLGVLPIIKHGKRDIAGGPTERDHYVATHPRSTAAECARTIRTNLLFTSPDHPAKLLVVTSSGPREGKSTTVVSLAVAMAQAGARVVVVDTDMRRPRLHKSFAIDNRSGLSTAILGEASCSEVVQRSGVDKLDVMACGPIPPNPAELLHTDAFRQLVSELASRYDRVVFDSPPVSAVTDALVLSSMVDGVLLVVQAGKTSWPMALQAKRQLQDLGARVLGVVLNEVDLDSLHYGGHYQYYYYGSGYGEDAGEKHETVAG